MLLLAKTDSEQDGVMIALKPSDEVREALAIDGGEDVDNLHVTLAFLGKEEDFDKDELLDLIEDMDFVRESLDGGIAGYGTFQNGESHVLWAAVDVPGINEMRAELKERVKEDLDIDLEEEHGFTPHMTLDYSDLPFEDMPELDDELKESKPMVPYLVIGGDWVNLENMEKTAADDNSVDEELLYRGLRIKIPAPPTSPEDIPLNWEGMGEHWTDDSNMAQDFAQGTGGLNLKPLELPGEGEVYGIFLSATVPTEGISSDWRNHPTVEDVERAWEEERLDWHWESQDSIEDYYDEDMEEWAEDIPQEFLDEYAQSRGFDSWSEVLEGEQALYGAEKEVTLGPGTQINLNGVAVYDERGQLIWSDDDSRTVTAARGDYIFLIDSDGSISFGYQMSTHEEISALSNEDDSTVTQGFVRGTEMNLYPFDFTMDGPMPRAMTDYQIISAVHDGANFEAGGYFHYNSPVVSIDTVTLEFPDYEFSGDFMEFIRQFYPSREVLEEYNRYHDENFVYPYEAFQGVDEESGWEDPDEPEEGYEWDPLEDDPDYNWEDEDPEKLGMAERSGSTQLDQIIEQFLSSSVNLNESGTHPGGATPVSQLVEKCNSWGQCDAVASAFEQYLNEQGIHYEEGYSNDRMHYWSEVETSDGVFLVDFSASQFGETELPLVMRLKDEWVEPWREQFEYEDPYVFPRQVTDWAELTGKMDYDDALDIQKSMNGPYDSPMFEDLWERTWGVSDEPLDKLGGLFLKVAESNQVEQKAQKIFDNGGVEFVAANPDTERGRTLWEFDVHSTSGETYQVYGDSMIDNPSQWIDWRDVACGCPWGKWNYDRAPEYKHLESLQCSHSMASEKWLMENGERENQRAIREQETGQQEIPFGEETTGPRKPRPGEQYRQQMGPPPVAPPVQQGQPMQQPQLGPVDTRSLAPGAEGPGQPGVPGINQEMQYPGGNVPGIQPAKTPAEINDYMDPNEEDGPQEVQEPQPDRAAFDPIFDPQTLMPRSPEEKKSWWKNSVRNWWGGG